MTLRASMKDTFLESVVLINSVDRFTDGASEK